MLTCRQAISRLEAHESGELVPTDRLETKRHLVRCESCLSYRRSYRVAVALGRAAYGRDDPADLEMPDELARRILARTNARWAVLASAGHVIHILSGIAAAPLIAFWLR